MRLSQRLKMTSSSLLGSKASLDRDVALQPPLHLYRRLLRLHRTKIPPDLRVLGDGYLKSEFREHRNVENPIHIVGFLTEWQRYAQHLEEYGTGEKLDKARLQKMSDDQIGQFYELWKASRGYREWGGISRWVVALNGLMFFLVEVKTSLSLSWFPYYYTCIPLRPIYYGKDRETRGHENVGIDWKAKDLRTLLDLPSIDKSRTLLMDIPFLDFSCEGMFHNTWKTMKRQWRIPNNNHLWSGAESFHGM